MDQLQIVFTCAVRILAKGILDVETGELEEANLEETYPCSENAWSDNLGFHKNGVFMSSIQGRVIPEVGSDIEFVQTCVRTVKGLAHCKRFSDHSRGSSRSQFCKRGCRSRSFPTSCSA